LRNVKRILVLGGCGFIGSHVVDRFVSKGHAVRVLSRKPEIFRKPVDEVDYHFGDIADQKLLGDCLQEINIVVHLVSTTTPMKSNLDISFDIESNLIQSVKCMQLCSKARIEKFVFISSGGAIYGNPTQCPVSELAMTEPLCSYGVVKLAAEKYLELFRSLENLNSVTLRVGNPFGPRQDPQSGQGIVAATLNRIHLNKPIVVWGDGSVVRDYLFVKDLADAVYAAAFTPSTSRVFNIGSGKGLSILELLNSIKHELRVNFDVQFEVGRAFDVRRIYLDSSLASDQLNWTPQTTLGDALRETWNFIKQIPS